MRVLARIAFALMLTSGSAQASPIWSNYAGDAQHDALSSVASQSLDRILWQVSVDQSPQYSGNDLLIHYGSPLVTQANTVIVPVKTGASGGFEVQARSAADGSLKWSQTTDYILPPHNWTPSFSPALTPTGRLYLPGAGGTVYFRDNPDSPTGASGQISFFGNANYTANTAALNNSVYIDTPITSDNAGNIYFGYKVTGGNPLGLQSGIARISAAGVGTYVSATAASGDAGLGQVAMNAAPALSADGSTVYVAVNSGNFGRGALVALNSSTLATTAVRALKDPLTGQDSVVPDDGTASPMVAPDGRVYYGVLESPFHTSKGWLLSFNGDLTVSSDRPAGGFGWDDTPSVVPTSMVPSYSGTASYLLMSKYNNYVETGGDGVNKVAILDPTASTIDPRSGATVMKIVESIAGPTPDLNFFPTYLNAVREWCINTAVVDPYTDSVLVNSEDGKLYRWNLGTNTLSQEIVLTPGVGEAYTPTIIGGNGTVYAINNATLFAVGADSIPEPSGLAVFGLAVLGLWRAKRSAKPLHSSAPAWH
jgi:hypothetical protein